jgi:hypothetical protein
VHPGHLARVAGIEPGEKAIDLLAVGGRGVGNTDKVEAEGKGLLLNLFRNRHFFAHTKRVQGATYIISRLMTV